MNPLRTYLARAHRPSATRDAGRPSRNRATATPRPVEGSHTVPPLSLSLR